MIRGPVLICAVFLALHCKTVSAETVRLITPGGGYGHGWMYVSPDGYCRIATPAHVVAGPDGALGDALVINAQGAERRVVDPVQPDPDVDVAFLTVETTVAERLCTGSRLGLDRLDGRLSRWREGYITTSVEGETRTIRVERRARSVDARGGMVFAVAPVRAEDRIVQGMSGSAVLDADAAQTPLGLLIEAVPDENAAIALRFDVVKSLANDAAQKAPVARRAATGAVAAALIGRSADPGSSAASVLEPGGVWHVLPESGVVRIVVTYESPVSFSSVSLAPAPGTGPAMLEIKAADSAEGTFRNIGFCRGNAEQVGIACRTMPITAGALMLTLTGPAAGFSVGALTLR